MDMGKDETRTKGVKKPTVAATIEQDTHDRLMAYCEKYNKYVSNIVNLAVSQFLDKEEKKEK